MYVQSLCKILTRIPRRWCYYNADVVSPLLLSAVGVPSLGFEVTPCKFAVAHLMCFGQHPTTVNIC